MSRSPLDYATLLDTHSFETAFDVEAGKAWVNTAKYKCFPISFVYVVLVFAGRRYMKDRKALRLRTPHFIWNAVLALFSVAEACHLVPKLVAGVVAHGWRYSICDPSVFRGPSGFWAFVFAASKIVELVDTVFIVVRRQPLMFLHWYHHITVMIYRFSTATAITSAPVGGSCR